MKLFLLNGKCPKTFIYLILWRVLHISLNSWKECGNNWNSKWLTVNTFWVKCFDLLIKRFTAFLRSQNHFKKSQVDRRLGATAIGRDSASHILLHSIVGTLGVERLEKSWRRFFPSLISSLDPTTATRHNWVDRCFPRTFTSTPPGLWPVSFVMPRLRGEPVYFWSMTLPSPDIWFFVVENALARGEGGWDFWRYQRSHQRDSDFWNAGVSCGLNDFAQFPRTNHRSQQTGYMGAQIIALFELDGADAVLGCRSRRRDWAQERKDLEYRVSQIVREYLEELILLNAREQYL